jgi:glutathione S-transferase
MSITFYTSKGSGAYAVECALVQAGAAFTPVEIDTAKDEQHEPSFVAVNPMRQVPALSLGDGTVMTESMAIILQQAAMFPARGIAPAPGTAAGAQYLRWLTFMVVNLYEADLRYFYPERYVVDGVGLTSVKAAAAAHMLKGFNVMEAHALTPGPFICGATLTKWSPEPVTLPGITAVVQAVAAHPVYGPLWVKHGFAA